MRFRSSACFGRDNARDGHQHSSDIRRAGAPAGEIEVIVAEGIGAGPEHREKALAGALQAATDLRAA
jgi:hypothetical protein